MKTKKLLALLMAGTMSVSMLSGCGGSAAKTNDSSADATDTSASAESDVDYVKSNGKLVIGITDFAPMDYKEDGSDEWVGFDADMAKAFGGSWVQSLLQLPLQGAAGIYSGHTGFLLRDPGRNYYRCS